MFGAGKIDFDMFGCFGYVVVIGVEIDFFMCVLNVFWSSQK
jgi:hypothetical protein